MSPDDTSETEYEPRKVELLVAALLEKPTIALAAKQAGVSKRTALRWMQQAEFQKAYREARRSVVENTIAVMQQRSMLATAVLYEIASNKAEKGSVRVSAARSILEYSLKGVELLDHETRITELEAGRAEASE
jgi:hypothetical protein